jgi:hypothetical protein
MAKRLVNKSWDEVQQEMSIAGEPERARKFGEDVHELSCESMDTNNISSIDNQIFALERVIAELKNWRKILESRQRII